VTCTAPLVPSGADCVIPAPRPIAPLSGTFVGTRSPTLSWSLPTGITSAELEVCSDRACSKVLYSATVSGSSAAVGTALPRGTAFWRLRGELASDAGSTMAPTSPVWQFQVGGAHDAPKSAAWGVSPDYNGDGFADLLLQTSATPSTVQLYTGTSTGLSSSPISVGSGSPGGGSVFVPGDVDGDGFVDLVVPNDNGNVYRGGPSGFAAAPSQSLQIRSDGSNAESIGDVNGDGYGDLVVPGEYVDADRNSFLTLSVYNGGPSGLSITPQTLTASVLHQPPFGNTDTGDFNGDGYADVVVGSVSNATNGVVSVFYGSPTGLGSTSTDIAMPTMSPGLSVACIGDANGDGYDDIVALRQSAYVYFGSSTGIGKSPTTLTAGQFNVGPGTSQALGVGDMNGDGYADFVVPDVSAPALRLYRGASTGINSTPLTLNPTPPANFTVSSAMINALTAIGDIDGDGYTDVAVAIDWTSTQQVHKRQVDIFGGANPAVPAVLAVGATALR
jgi:hypothetical protein